MTESSRAIGSSTRQTFRFVILNEVKDRTLDCGSRKLTSVIKDYR